MSYKKLTQQGIAYVEILIAVVVIGIIGFVGYKVLNQSSAAAQLTWSPPALTSPTTITVTNANKRAAANLDPKKDYIVKIGEKITGAGSVVIVGGRNVVLIGGEISHNETGGPENDPGKDQRALYLKNWTGTMHIEGLYISGSTLGEGIDVDTRTPGSILQLQNIRVDTVHGSQATNHADIVQNWGGPTYYRIDRLTGSTDYQGFMTQPTQFDSAMVTKELDFRNVNITGTVSGYKFFRAGGTEKLSFTNVYFQPLSGSSRKPYYPESDPAFAAIKIGTAPADFVPAGTVGMNYVSPGYLNGAPAPTTTTTTPTTTTPTPTTPTIKEVINSSFTTTTTWQAVLSTWALSNGRYGNTAVKNNLTTNSNLATNPTVVSGDFTLNATGKVVGSSSAWDDFSVIFGYQDTNNYYYVSFNESNDNGTSGIFKVQNGTKTQLKDITTAVKADTDYKVTVVRAGDVVKVSLNGAEVANVSDATYKTGKIGLGSMNNTVSFDSVVVTQP